MENKIVYENKPYGATQNSINSVNDMQEFVNMEEIKQQLLIPKNATLENDLWQLDGSYISFPDNPIGIGYISKSMSNEEGIFDDEIILTRIYDNTYTSPGIMISFDTNTDNYATDVNIKWYRDTELLVSKDFTPNASKYFFHQDVVAYNKIVITFRKTNIGFRYLRIFFIEDGIVREFYKDELKNLKIIEEVSSNTENLSMNTLDIELNSKSDVGVLFQKTLPMKLYRDNALVGAFFIDRAEKENIATYKIEAVDYIGLIENEKFLGGMYTNELVSNIVANILGTIPYQLDNTIGKRTITGFIDIQSKREALQKVIFSAGGIVDCSRNECIAIKPLDNTIKSVLGKDKIVSIKEEIESITTSIELVQHRYTAQSEESEIFNDTITGETLITLGAPYHSLRISGGTLLTVGTNYAVISGSGTVILYGKGYEDNTVITSKNNPLTVSTDVRKVKTYDTTLICNEINLLDKLNFVAKILKIKFKMSNNEMVGDMINVLGENARILCLEYSINTPSIYALAELEVL